MVENLTYKKNELFLAYEGKLNYKDFQEVCDTFFNLASTFVLHGGYLHTPVGVIFIKRVKHTRQYVDLGKLRYRKEGESIMRENNWHDAFEWTPARGGHFHAYDFKAAFDNERSIPKTEAIRNHKIVQRRVS